MWQPEKRHALIDGDIVAYSCAWVANNAPDKSAAFAAARDMILNIREALSLDDADIYLTGPGNFRKDICADYKAHRAETPKPRYLFPTLDYLQDYWGASWREGLEADDLLGIEATKDPTKVICSTDKDLDQIPGFHYNWRKYSMYYVAPEEGDKWFWKQMLIGDTVDNIKGIRGIGPVKADKLLNDLSLDECRNTVYRLYSEADRLHDFEINSKLLFILKEYP